jgi:hypothetical protein
MNQLSSQKHSAHADNAETNVCLQDCEALPARDAMVE